MLGAVGGCDTAQVRPNDQADPSTEVQGTGESFDQADLLYEPVSLAPGETFTLALVDDQFDRGVTRIVHEGTPDGDQQLRAHFAPLQPSSVTITCRNQITDTEQTITTLSGDDLAPGTGAVATAEDDPDSYHYETDGDDTIIMVDYDTEESKSSGSSQTTDEFAPGPTLRFSSSDQPTHCTHVAFTLQGVSTALSPDGVQFGGDVEAPSIRKKKFQ